MVDPDTLRSFAAFARVSAPGLRVIADHSTERQYGEGQVLFTAGSIPPGLLLVIEGRVRVIRGRGDRQHLVHYESPGGALGEVPVFAGGTYPATAVAAEPTRCVLVPAETIIAAIRVDPEVALAFLARLAERTRGLVARLDRLAVHSVRDRLTAFLLERQRLAGAGVPFSLGATQEEVAQDLGTVREVLVRGIRELVSTGHLRRASRGLYLMSEPR
jgi:CRP/FNR family transcriptional regulator, dissimilatory nitrate respiration regulator